jgi:hypothetical protein
VDVNVSAMSPPTTPPSTSSDVCGRQTACSWPIVLEGRDISVGRSSYFLLSSPCDGGDRLDSPAGRLHCISMSLHGPQPPATLRSGRRAPSSASIVREITVSLTELDADRRMAPWLIRPSQVGRV